MRAVATLFAFIAMIVFAVTTSESKKNYGGNDWVDGMPLAPVCPTSFVASSFHPIPRAFWNFWWLCTAWYQSFSSLSNANCGVCRSSLPCSTILWSSSSLSTNAMAVPSTRVGTLVWISSSGPSLSLQLFSQSAMAGSGTGSLFFSSSMASSLATSGTSGVTNAIRSSTPWGRWRLRPMCSWP